MVGRMTENETKNNKERRKEMGKETSGSVDKEV
jgi:hypothetical protein